MAKNLELYPEDFPPVSTIEIQSEFDYLESSVLKTALKQILSIRSAGQMTTRNQTQLMISHKGKMKTEFIGPNIIIRPEDDTPLQINPSKIPNNIKGTTGFFFGGDRLGDSSIDSRKSIEKLHFLGDLKETISSTLTEGKQFMGVGGTQTNAWLFGGWNTSTGNISSAIEKIDYQSENTLRMGQSLSTPRHSLGAANNNVSAYLMGGGTNQWIYTDPNYPFSRMVDKFSLFGEVLIALGISLNQSRSCTPNLKGNKYSVWIFGESGAAWEVLNTVERFDFATETISPVSLAIGHNFAGTANLGNERFLYSVGGKSNNKENWKKGESAITKFDMEAISSTRMNLTLNTPRCGLSSVNSNQFGYIAGGWANPSSSLPSDKIEKLMSLGTGESLISLGISLQSPRAEFGSISNYGETFFGG